MPEYPWYTMAYVYLCLVLTVLGMGWAVLAQCIQWWEALMDWRWERRMKRRNG